MREALSGPGPFDTVIKISIFATGPRSNDGARIRDFSLHAYPA